MCCGPFIDPTPSNQIFSNLYISSHSNASKFQTFSKQRIDFECLPQIESRLRDEATNALRDEEEDAEGRRLAPDAQYFLVREQEKNEKRKFSMQIFFGEREREIVMDQRFKMERPRWKYSNLYSNKTLYLHNFNVWHSRNRVEHKSCIHFGVVNIYHSQHLYESQSHKEILAYQVELLYAEKNNLIGCSKSHDYFLPKWRNFAISGHTAVSSLSFLSILQLITQQCDQIEQQNF